MKRILSIAALLPAAFVSRAQELSGSDIVRAKAGHMAAVDPHGFTITVVSVSVVFGALIILFIAYSLMSLACNTRPRLPKAMRRKKAAAHQDEVAAAIAMALQMEKSSETEAAIALALDRYLDGAVHDEEPYIITIRRKN